MKVLLNLGMGVDSSVIAHRWLNDDSSRDFDLTNLTVVTAMTGNEFDDTRRVVESHLLPLFRKNAIRYVQLARSGPKREDGITVLSDTRSPDRLHLEGVYTLGEELTAAGTGPQVASRRCSIKFKGWVIDQWIAGEFAGQPFRQVMGFNADEQRRVSRDQCYGGENRKAEYPLMTWGMGRAACEAYLLKHTGERWPKSCCTFCPFTNGKPEVLARYHAMPGRAADALLLELVAMALNPRMTLYRDRSLYSILLVEGNPEPFRILHERLAGLLWAVYRVRRVYKAKGRADRSVERLVEGTRDKVLYALQVEATRAGQAIENTANGPRFYTVRRRVDAYPAFEEMYVAAPALANDKAKKNFERGWAPGQLGGAA